VDFEISSPGFDIDKAVREAAGLKKDDQDQRVVTGGTIKRFERGGKSDLDYPTFLRRQAD
jgi:uncharacterized protein (UPF0335 family)